MIEAVENQSEKLNLTETLFNHEDMPLKRAIKPVRHDTHRKELNWNEYYNVAPGDAYPYGRTVVAKPSGWPYCCIGMVSCQFEDKSLRSGLGALILGNFVLTCSRLVHSQSTGQLAKQIWFISLVQHHKGRATRVIKVDTQKKSEKQNEQDWDLALLELECQSLIDTHGHLPIRDQHVNIFNNVMSVFSYYQPKPNTLMLCEQRKHLRNFNHSNQQLGSPVLTRLNSDRYETIIGVYVGGHREIVYTTKISSWISTITSTKRQELFLQPSKLNNLAGSETIKIARLRIADSQYWRSNIPKHEHSDKLMVLPQYTLPSLLHLSINHIQLYPEMLAQIASREPWPLLTSLSLAYCQIGDRGLNQLVKCKWPHLTELNLRDCHITDEGLMSIRLCQWLQLRRLTLSNHRFNEGSNKLTYDCSRVLLHMNWINLSRLHFSNSPYIDSRMLIECLRSSFQYLETIEISSEQPNTTNLANFFGQARQVAINKRFPNAF